jgi:hypothetical protein
VASEVADAHVPADLVEGFIVAASREEPDATATL